MSAAPLEKRFYTAIASATSGREGRVQSDDGALDLGLSMPTGLGGPGGAGTNPEQLFAGGYAACFGSAMGHVARTKKLETGPLTVTARVSIGPKGEAFGLQVELVASVPGLPRAEAEALMRAAHEVCPYSAATRGNIVVDLSLA